MTCKDCIHFGACKEHERLMLTIDNLYELMYQEGVENSCEHFKIVKWCTVKIVGIMKLT